MKTINTSLIQSELSKVFENVQVLTRVESASVAIKGSRVSTVKFIEGLQAVIGQAPSDVNDLENCNYIRFVYFPQTAQSFLF